MNRFPLIFNHYLKRNLADPMSIVFYFLMPIGLIVLNMLGSIGLFQLSGDYDSANLTATATFLAVIFMVSFQFFSGELIIHNIYGELRGPVSSRLFVSPVPQRTFIMGCAVSCWVFNIIQALVIFIVTAIFFDVYWGNPLVFIAVLLLISIMSQLIGALISILVPTRKVASGILNGLAFLMMFLSGMLFISFGDSPIATFITSYATPLALGFRAILFAGPVFDDMSRAMFNLGILTVITVVLGFIVFVLGRRRSL